MSLWKSDNIALSYVYSFVSSFGLTDAIWMLYLARRGMSLVEIGLLESIFHVTSMFMEIPTGIVADRLGRKTSRLLSRVVAFVATLLMLASHDFPGFAFAFVLVALSYNLESGAGDALVYDSLVDAGREGEYMKVKGRQEIGYQAAQGLSIALGGTVATWSYELAYILTAGIHLLSFAMALGFKEPLAGRGGIHGEGRGDPGSRSDPGRHGGLAAHIVDSARVIRNNRGIFLHILFLETFSLFYTTLYFWFQTFLKSRGWLEWSIGLLLGLSATVAAVMATQTHRVEARLGSRAIIGLAPFAALACFALIAFTGFEAFALVLLSALEGLLFVTFSDYINRLIPSESRATLLSFQAMVLSVMMIIFFPAIGALAGSKGYKVAFVVIFAAAVPVLLVSRGLLLADVGKEGGVKGGMNP
jgi:MFS family permease